MALPAYAYTPGDGETRSLHKTSHINLEHMFVFYMLA